MLEHDLHTPDNVPTSQKFYNFSFLFKLISGCEVCSTTTLRAIPHPALPTLP